MLTAFCRGMHIRPPDHPGPLGGSWRPHSFQRDGDAGISRRCQGEKWRARGPRHRHRHRHRLAGSFPPPHGVGGARLPFAHAAAEIPGAPTISSMLGGGGRGA